MRVVAYTALHYGTDYLGWAIRSVIRDVDAYYVLYAAQGSHGSRTMMPCPDTRDQLYEIARKAAGDKLVWKDGDWLFEGAQRGEIHGLEPDADIILALDADEIWAPDLAQHVIQFYRYGLLGGRFDIQTLRVPMIHYWRSFYRAILHDPAYPVRAIFQKYPEGGDWTLETDRYINHMGYAQRSELVQYKLLTHGHKGEFRRDIRWLEERFLANAQIDLHPVGSQYWNAERVAPATYMPEWMVNHKYAGLDLIP